MSEEQNVVVKEEVGTNEEKKQEKKEIIKSVFKVIVFIVIIVGGFASGCVRCTNCGDDDNRLFVYASGTSEDGIEYKSCVGPAGCLGFGINSKCWPTECSYVKKVTEASEMSGCVTYYNEMGCIAKSDVKSEGKYSDNATCLGIDCIGTKYVETVAESTQAKEQMTCFGMTCGGAAVTESRDYNSQMPRQFTSGCWSNE